MTVDKKLKGRIRARMRKTGERYSAARAAVVSQQGSAFRRVVLKVIALGEAANREYDEQRKTRKGAGAVIVSVR